MHASLLAVLSCLPGGSIIALIIRCPISITTASIIMHAHGPAQSPVRSVPSPPTPAAAECDLDHFPAMRYVNGSRGVLQQSTAALVTGHVAWPASSAALATVCLPADVYHYRCMAEHWAARRRQPRRTPPPAAPRRDPEVTHCRGGLAVVLTTSAARQSLPELPR